MTTDQPWTSLETPLGELLLTSDGQALTGVWFPEHRAGTDPRPAELTSGPRADHLEVLVAARGQLRAYFAGELTDFDLRLEPVGSSFQQRVWAQLRRIPYGATATYGQVAADLGLEVGAARAVGSANGANPISIVVPCHRVVGGSGTLTGYAGGLNRKRFLLELEAQTLF